MKNGMFILWHILSTLFRLLLPGGARSIVAENATLRRQLLILSRKQQRSSNLKPEDRFFLGWCVDHLSFQRIIKNAVIIKPATILCFHKASKEGSTSYFTVNAKPTPPPDFLHTSNSFCLE